MGASIRPAKIGNAQGFWGDSVDAPQRLIEQQPDLDYLTLDYLAEVSLSIMAMQRHRDASLGYARDFVDVVRSLAPHWRAGSPLKLISNAGGLNPVACAEACAAALRDAGCPNVAIGVVTGDDVLPVLLRSQQDATFNNWETGASISTVAERLVTANAYLGAESVASALASGAQIVISGRVADPSMVVAACLHHFGWSAADYDRIAGATIAGHTIECGTQATGGISTHWLHLSNPADIGFPVVEVFDDGSCVVTKPENTGGEVTERTVKEQLLYEIGDPDNYLSPDARVSFLSLSVREEAKDRVRVSGAKGFAPPSTYKVSATYRDGYWAHGTLTIFGRDAVTKAKRCGEIIFERVRRAGYELARTNIECLGANACSVGAIEAPPLIETVLRVSAADPRREAIDRFAKELAPLVTSGPQGITGYAAGRPKAHPVFGYWPCLIVRDSVNPKVSLFTL